MNKNRRRTYTPSSLFNYSWVGIPWNWDYITNFGIIPIYLPNSQYGYEGEYYQISNSSQLMTELKELGSYYDTNRIYDDNISMYTSDGKLYFYPKLGLNAEVKVDLSSLTAHASSNNTYYSSYSTLAASPLMELSDGYKIWCNNSLNSRISVSKDHPGIDYKDNWFDMDLINDGFNLDSTGSSIFNYLIDGDKDTLYILSPYQTVDNYSGLLTSVDMKNTKSIKGTLTLNFSTYFNGLGYPRHMIYVPESDSVVVTLCDTTGHNNYGIEVVIIKGSTLELYKHINIPNQSGVEYPECSNLVSIGSNVYFISTSGSGNPVFISLDTNTGEWSSMNMNTSGWSLTAGWAYQKSTSTFLNTYAIGVDNYHLICNKVVIDNEDNYIFSIYGGYDESSSLHVNLYSIGTDGYLWQAMGGGRYGPILYTGLGEY